MFEWDEGEDYGGWWVDAWVLRWVLRERKLQYAANKELMWQVSAAMRPPIKSKRTPNVPLNLLRPLRPAKYASNRSKP